MSPEQMRDRWGLCSPSSPAGALPVLAALVAQPKVPSQGTYLVSPHLSAPFLLPILICSSSWALLCQQSWGSQAGQAAEGPCRSLPAPQPHCSVGCSRDWHPFLLGFFQGGSSSFCPGLF